MSIKERKIYHTGEGYFIVTPHTYFVTDKVMRHKKKALSEDNCSSLPPVTYLVSIDNCTDLTKENVPTMTRCRSCHCFPDQTTFSEQRDQQLMNHELKGRGQKGSKMKLSLRSQSISTSANIHYCDTIKSLTSVKGKVKCAMPKKTKALHLKNRNLQEYSTFSVQFPPKEWPVRDEDSLDNIPRDIEHEIIKHVNPLLTVDNLIKHTVLMQKFEELKNKQKQNISIGTSTEKLLVRRKHISKVYAHMKQNKTAKHHNRINWRKGNQSGQTQSLSNQ